MDVKKYSLRLRLLVLITIPLFLTGAAVASLSLLNAYHEIEEVYDAELVHTAQFFLRLAEHELDEHKKEPIELGVEESVSTHPYEKNIAFRIWKEELLVTQSASAREFAGFRAPPGFSNHRIGDDEWRFFVFLGEKSGVTVEVAEKQDVRQDITQDLAKSLTLPASLFIPLVLILVWWGASRSLKPFDTLSRAIDSRDVNDLSAVRVAAIPREIMPLIKALNDLFLRMEESIQREREFTDNAAHELRTPLAAMKMQAQVLLKKSRDDQEREGLDNLVAAIDRAARMIEQLLSFSRLQSQDFPFCAVDFSLLTEETLKEVSSLVVAKKKELGSDIQAGIIVQGNDDALRIMLRNLLDNALKFMPESGQLKVALSENGGKVLLEVMDSGPGIPDDQKKQIFERFYRIKKSGTQGSGLGLAMVKWIASAHGAHISVVDNKPTGANIQVTFYEG